MSYSAQLLPLLLERAGVRRIKSGTYYFPSSNLLPLEKALRLV